MKRIFQAVTVICALLVIAGAAWPYSVMIGSTIVDVGGLDTIITSDALKNSGDDTELSWVETVNRSCRPCYGCKIYKYGLDQD